MRAPKENDMDLNTLKQKMDEARYVYDETLITVLYVALRLNRPLLIEGAAGVGKTEIAKVMASALGRELVRMQCYEGLDESKSLYEWNYQKQLLSIQVQMGTRDSDELTKSLFSDEYLLERPLLRSIRAEKPVVLLIDEIDKSDEEFEAFLLDELQREFYAEGRRWFDIKLLAIRRHGYVSFLDYNKGDFTTWIKTIYPGNDAYEIDGWNDRHQLMYWPIPQAERDKSYGALTQNPGYEGYK